MKFVVYSRKDMINANPSNKPWALISICEEGNFPEVHTNEVMLGRLNLKFHDIGFYKNGERHIDNRILFNENHAKQVLDFYADMQKKGMVVLYVHCLMGMSRSVGIAAALQKITTGDDDIWFKTRTPNMRVHQAIMYEANNRGFLN